MKHKIKLIHPSIKRLRTAEGYPIMLEVYLGRGDRIRLKSGYHFDKEAVSDTGLVRGRSSAAVQTNKQLKRMLDKAHQIDEMLGAEYTRKQFMDAWRGIDKEDDPSDLFKYFEIVIPQKPKGRTRNYFVTTLKHLKAFHPDPIPIYKVDKDFVEGYRKFLEEWLAPNTVRTHLSKLRNVLNLAVGDKNMDLKGYVPPFMTNRLLPAPVRKTRDRSLNPRLIQRLFELPTAKGRRHYKSQRLYHLSYLCYGANLIDLALLKQSSIVGGTLEFDRSKTGRQIPPVVITSEMEQIFEDLKPYCKEDYLVHILKDEFNWHNVRTRVDRWDRHINDWLSSACDVLGIQPKVTFYSARHSFAQHLRYADKSDSFIARFLAHSSESTVKGYLVNHDVKQLIEVQDSLLQQRKP